MQATVSAVVFPPDPHPLQQSGGWNAIMMDDRKLLIRKPEGQTIEVGSQAMRANLRSVLGCLSGPGLPLDGVDPETRIAAAMAEITRAAHAAGGPISESVVTDIIATLAMGPGDDLSTQPSAMPPSRPP